jgi:hypothetical protein
VPTGQTIINQALTTLNILDAGGTPSPSESADLLLELNAMVEAWGTEETLIPSIATAGYALTAAKNPYAMGPAAAAPFNVPRPVRVVSAYQVSPLGAGTSRNKIRIVGATEYFAHNDLGAQATSPDELYIDWADVAGSLQLYLFPVPSQPTTSLELETWTPVAAFALGVNQPLPSGYQDAIQYGLAYRCIPRYGAVVNQAVAQVVTDIGKQAKQRIQKLNVMNRLLDPSLMPPTPAQEQAAAQQSQQR